MPSFQCKNNHFWDSADTVCPLCQSPGFHKGESTLGHHGPISPISDPTMHVPHSGPVTRLGEATIDSMPIPPPPDQGTIDSLPAIPAVGHATIDSMPAIPPTGQGTIDSMPAAGPRG